MVSDSSDLDKLKAAAARIRKAQESADPNRVQTLGGWGRPNPMVVRYVRIGSDFVASVVIPTVVGRFVDQELGTQPWVMLGLLIAGFSVGLWVIVRATGEAGGERSKKVPDQDDGSLKE